MARVYFHDIRDTGLDLDAIDRLLSSLPSLQGLTAVKLHFGESGNTRGVKPQHVRRVVDWLRSKGAHPFLTDAATLYKGKRNNALDHMATAKEHGFSPDSMGCPVLIADGLIGEDYREVGIRGKIFQKVKIASAICQADSLVSINHFKGHNLTGFGGCLKNLGMGCAPPEGKKDMHGALHVESGEDCTGCGECVESCRFGSLSIVEGRCVVDLSKCTGCGGCIKSCPEDNLRMVGDIDDLQRRVAEYALGALKGKRAIHISFLMDITKLCDCVPFTLPLVARDIGVVSSTDPVAIDKASLDLFEEENGGLFRRHLNPETQLLHGESIGLGEMRYELVEV
jgi:hypothetical protein